MFASVGWSGRRRLRSSSSRGCGLGARFLGRGGESVTSASQARTTIESVVEGGVCVCQRLSKLQRDGVAGIETKDGERAIARMLCYGSLLLLWFAKVGGRKIPTADAGRNSSDADQTLYHNHSSIYKSTFPFKV